MKYSAAQAQKIAKQIRDRFGKKIAEACGGTPVPQNLVAGLIGVEAGKDRNGQLREDATRFEPGVFAKLKRVRDKSLTSYNNLRYSHVKDLDDAGLRNLSTSFGLTQTMGWWAIHLGISVADLRDPQKHIGYAVQLLLLNAAKYIESGNYLAVFRIWNSGSPTGKTYDPDYVYNAGAVMDAYSDDLIVEDAISPLNPPLEPTEVAEQNPEPPAAPQAPKPEVIPVSAPSTSITTKVAAAASAAGPVIAATGLKIGGVEFKTGGLVAIAAVVIVGMLVAAYLWNESQKRAFERQRLSMENLASETKSNVIAAGSKV